MKFSVIVPTRNRPAALAACLQSFCQLNYPPGDWELIVVNDGGDALQTAVSEHLRQGLPLQLIDMPHAGPASARNRGAEAAHFPFLAFTDDDCQVSPDWLQQFAHGFAQTGCDALGGRSLNPQPHNVAMQASQFLVEFMVDYMRDEANNHLMLVSNNVAYKRVAFTAVSGFNETFPLAAGEDMELGFRLVAKGFRQGYWPAAQVWHHHNLTRWGHVLQQFRYGRGGHFFLQVRAEQTSPSLAVQPGSAKNFYVALGEALWRRREPLSLSLLIAVAQGAYRLGQLYQRQLGRFQSTSIP